MMAPERVRTSKSKDEHGRSVVASQTVVVACLHQPPATSHRPPAPRCGGACAVRESFVCVTHRIACTRVATTAQERKRKGVPRQRQLGAERACRLGLAAMHLVQRAGFEAVGGALERKQTARARAAVPTLTLRLAVPQPNRHLSKPTGDRPTSSLSHARTCSRALHTATPAARPSTALSSASPVPMS